MTKTLVVLMLLVAVCFSFEIKSPEPKSKLMAKMQDDMEKIMYYMPKINKFYRGSGLKDFTLECATCGVVVNEVWGMLEENRTDTYIQNKIREDVCARFSGSFKTICDGLANLVPFFIHDLADRSTANEVCVDFHLCSKPFPHENETQTMPTYIIDLDLPPQNRWTTVCSTPAYAKGWQNVINVLVGGLEDKGRRIADVGRELGTFMQQEYVEEINGCAAALGVDPGFVVLMQLGYEASDACTSIVAQDAKGNILHSRNLDFWDGITLADQLRDIAAIFDMRSKGQTVFKFSTPVGYMGALSGQRPGQFSVTIDTRFYPNGMWEMFDEIIFALEHYNATLVAFLTRSALEYQTTYDTAVQYLSTNTLVADVYYTLAGNSPGQGIVLARNRTDVANTTQIDVSKGKWFTLITNYDWWKPQPWFDDRYGPAIEYMNKMNQSTVTLDGMFKVMSTKPVLNLQTVYTFLSNPSNSTYETYIRYCNFPCVQ